MLYTIMPIEHVLGAPPRRQDSYATWEVPAKPIMGPLDAGDASSPISCDVNGVPLIVWPMPDGKGIVERIMSTNPADYLNPAIAPGSKIDIGVRL